ncbi:MAG: NADH-quinone oxidoreductase subunit NuoH, partial [Vulcanisaeta sp.]
MKAALSIINWASSLISGLITSTLQLIYSVIQYILTRPEVNIPFLNPIIDFLNKAPVINIIVH